MKPEIVLKPMTREGYHSYFLEYEDEDSPYIYDGQMVDAYVQRQKDRGNHVFAVMNGDELVGEVKIYNMAAGISAELGIAMKNSYCRNRGFGTEAERLAVEYVFYQLDIPMLYARCRHSNTRSQRVLEKAGFYLISEDEERKYYQITRKG